jgi:acyl transferase domain-containing protein
VKEQELNFIENENFDIAIIGMSARFPKSPDLESYWENLVNGVECITFFDETELEVSFTDKELKRPDFVRAAGIIENIEYFDADFFNIGGREATWMDPQQRLFLECAWTAFENAGYDIETYKGSVSVYGGTNTNFYLLSRLEQLSQNKNNNLFQLMLANEKDFLATRVAYKFNLKGESVTVQTSCSTSLVAVHLACQSLLGFQSDMALAGGVSIRVPQKTGYFYQEGMIASPDGHCRAFDEKAKGTVPGSGVGIVILKRLADAIADGDTINAVIRGSAINNDGQDKVM